MMYDIKVAPVTFRWGNSNGIPPPTIYDFMPPDLADELPEREITQADLDAAAEVWGSRSDEFVKLVARALKEALLSDDGNAWMDPTYAPSDFMIDGCVDLEHVARAIIPIIRGE